MSACASDRSSSIFFPFFSHFCHLSFVQKLDGHVACELFYPPALAYARHVGDFFGQKFHGVQNMSLETLWSCCPTGLIAVLK